MRKAIKIIYIIVCLVLFIFCVNFGQKIYKNKIGRDCYKYLKDSKIYFNNYCINKKNEDFINGVKAYASFATLYFESNFSQYTSYFINSRGSLYEIIIYNYTDKNNSEYISPEILNLVIENISKLEKDIEDQDAAAEISDVLNEYLFSYPHNK